MSRSISSSNINHLWSGLLIEELIRNGADYFCLSPGSRSSPLACAVAENPKANSLIHFDERGSAFHALGYASATGKPSVVITTSGTAAANLLPAVIEASKKKVPLIILTADRPPELRFTGANQTIDQVKIFGEYTRWFFDMPCPTAQIPAEFILTTVDQAVFRAQGELKGPVHINCMYREPLAPLPPKTRFTSYLAPLKSWMHKISPYTHYQKVLPVSDARAVNAWTRQLKSIRSGVIVVGKLTGEEERAAVLNLARKLNWPVLPDISSGLRLGCTHKNVISYFDQILPSARQKIDGVLHLGGRITSQRWYDYVSAANPKTYITVLNHPLRNDPLHCVTARIQCPIEAFCRAVSGKIKQRGSSRALVQWQQANARVHRTVETELLKHRGLTEPAAARLISRYIPKGDALFLASSLPVREMDMYADPHGAVVAVGGNRGASGIDGTLASACGFAVGLKKRTTLLIGDLAMLYDLNSLAILKNLSVPIVMVVLNNNGGGIFNLLPIANFRSGFERFFGTPHGLGFAAAAQMFDLNYARPRTKEEFVQSYIIALKSKTSTLIEIESERTGNAAIIQGLRKKVAQRA